MLCLYLQKYHNSVLSVCFLVFMSPEIAVVPTWRNIFKSPVFRENLCLVAVDEAHCITEWYASQQSKTIGVGTRGAPGARAPPSFQSDL